MKDNTYKKTKSSIKRIIHYIYEISPKYFIISSLFTILMGFTSAMSIWATKLLINGILEASTDKGNKFVRILIAYATINILILLIQSINNYINLKHQLKIDYKMSMDVLEKCKKLRLQDFEDSEVYNILGRAEMEGQIKVYMTYRNILSIITQIASIVSVSAIILFWDSYIFLLVFITPIVSTIVNTRIGYRNYKMRMGRMGEVRKSSYINYLLSNDIAYGFGNINEMNNDSKIEKILEEINLREKTDKFPEKVDTQMGEWFAGEELSKGQWQRIALGRVFMRDADVYILDEPTSSLDPISEKEIFFLVGKKSKDKMGIFIIQRVESIAELNPRVIVFSEGHIIGDGSNGKDIFVTGKGKQLLELVPSELKSPDLTAQWEKKLGLISKGKLNRKVFINEMREYSKTIVKEIKDKRAIMRYLIQI